MNETESIGWWGSFSQEACEIFGTSVFDCSCLNRGGGNILEHLIHEAFPDHVLEGNWIGEIRIREIGTCNGLSACFLSQFGPVVTYDIRRTAIVDDVVHRLAKNRIKRHIIRAATLRRDLPSKEFDLAFIDGEHSYEAVRADYTAVRHCGAVIFHDYRPGWRKYRERTVRAVDDIKSGKTVRLPPFALWTRVFPLPDNVRRAVDVDRDFTRTHPSRLREEGYSP